MHLVYPMRPREVRDVRADCCKRTHEEYFRAEFRVMYKACGMLSGEYRKGHGILCMVLPFRKAIVMWCKLLRRNYAT